MDYSKPIPVLSKDGIRGTIVRVASLAADTTHALVQFETGQQVRVPLDALSLQADQSYYTLALRHDELVQEHSSGAQLSGESLVLPVIVEQASVQKQIHITGRVRIRKTVQEREEVVDEPLLQQTVQVERVPINRIVEGEIPVRYEGDTMILSVLEEVLVVEKRLMLKEELHITQRRTEVHQPQQITLRSEDITVERIESNGDSAPEPAS